ncbi:MAG: PP2C family protein-serine/threonine phosphatase [Phycisphaerales bacterium]|nr:PP2C family protein-serine/threonine phosphatase [Phycisphaerales bacterium]
MQRLLYAATDSAGLNEAGLLARWIGPLLDAWPAKEAPRPTAVDLDDLLFPPDDEPMACGDPTLIVLDAGVPLERATRIADRLRERLIPAVVLTPTHGEIDRVFESRGLPVERWDAGAAKLASLLHALVRRQPALGCLHKTMERAKEARGGLLGEISRWHQEMDMAAAIQREMLPRELPSIPGCEAAALFRPASYVSGDIFDIHQIGEKCVSFFIADAVGHGVPAALLTMIIFQNLHRAEQQGDRSVPVEPASVMHRINKALCEQATETPRFATGIYGLLDPTNGRVRMCGAGHPSPWIVGREDTREIEAPGPLLGVFEEAEFEQVEFTLGVDEALLLYSDGFETAFPDPAGGSRAKSGKRHFDAFTKLLRPKRGEALADAMQSLASLLDCQAGSLHQHDDLTALLIARRDPAEAVRPQRIAA